LEEEARRKQDEQNQRDEHAGPVLHFLLYLLSDRRMLTIHLYSSLGSPSLSVCIAIHWPYK
jgi:hypothetical protein